MSAMLDMLDEQAKRDADLYRKGLDAGRGMQKREDYMAFRAIFAAFEMAEHDRNARIPSLLQAAITNAKRNIKP